MRAKQWVWLGECYIYNASGLKVSLEVQVAEATALDIFREMCAVRRQEEQKKILEHQQLRTDERKAKQKGTTEKSILMEGGALGSKGE